MIQEQRENWWQGEKRLRGCGRSRERKSRWTEGGIEVTTVGKVKEGKDIEKSSEKKGE